MRVSQAAGARLEGDKMRIHFCGVLALVSFVAVGCTAAKTSNTARTSTEQLLISNAVDQSLDKIDFTPFRGHQVFLNEKYVDCVDKPYLIASVRHRILKAGGRLVDSADKSQVTVELRAGAVGTFSSDSFIGVPEIVLPGVVTLPEVRVAERKSQLGTAKVGLVAYETATGQALGTGGMSLAQSQDNNWYVAGTGPFRSGALKTEITRGTTGAAAMQYAEVPPVVAFSPIQQQETQLAQEPATLDGVDPVSLEEHMNGPDWVKPAN